MGTSLYSLTQVSSKLYKSVPTVRRLKICTVECISNSFIHNFKVSVRALFLFSIQSYDDSDDTAVS